MEIFWSKKLKNNFDARPFHKFMQEMANRLMQGHARYGAPAARQRYMTRMIMEVKAYKRTGNAEFLRNIANYALLEDICPENERYHFDSTVDSTTRASIGV